MAEKMSVLPSGVVRFGVFQVNFAARELRKHGTKVRVQGQPFCILSMLLEKPGEIVTREEMRQRLWPVNTFVDFEHSLNSAIKKLRAALGDSPENSRYIETVPRVGYRFIAPAESVLVTVPQSANASVNTDLSIASAPLIRAGRRKLGSILGVSVVLIALLGAYLAWSHSRGHVQAHGSIAGEIHAEPGGRESTNSADRSALSPKSAEAHDLYLKGMYFWNKRTVTGFQQSIEYFNQATAADPDYALAYTGLANSYTLLTAYSSSSATLYMPQARAAALRALKLDEGSAEGHTALALIVQNQDWNWLTSEKEYRRAIELDPNYATAHQWYAEHLMWLGRFDEALKESEKAQQLDPLSLIIATDHGAILYNARQYDKAIEQLHTVLEKDPNFMRAVFLTTWAYAQRGLFMQALAEAEVLHRLYGDGPGYWIAKIYIYSREGLQKQAREEFEKLEKLSRHERLDPLTLLTAHLAVGDKEEALVNLEEAYSAHYSFMTSLKVDPALDPLRSDPRFQDLLRRVGLADNGGGSASTPKPH